MSKSKHTEAQMIGALKQLEAGRKVEDVAREVGVSKHTMYAWKAKYGGMEVSEAQAAKQLRDENGRLKKLVVDLSLDIAALPAKHEHLTRKRIFLQCCLHHPGEPHESAPHVRHSRHDPYPRTCRQPDHPSNCSSTARSASASTRPVMRSCPLGSST